MFNFCPRNPYIQEVISQYLEFNPTCVMDRARAVNKDISFTYVLPIFIMSIWIRTELPDVQMDAGANFLCEMDLNELLLNMKNKE